MSQTFSEVSLKELMEGTYTNISFVRSVASIIGCNVKLQTADGRGFEGIFLTFSPKFEVVLQLAHEVDPSLLSLVDSVTEKMIFPPRDIVLLEAIDVESEFVFKNGLVQKSEMVNSEKILEPWDDEDANAESFELNPATSEGWDPKDMFEKNEKLRQGSNGKEFSKSNPSHPVFVAKEKTDGTENTSISKEREVVTSKLNSIKTSHKSTPLSNTNAAYQPRRDHRKYNSANETSRNPGSQHFKVSQHADSNQCTKQSLSSVVPCERRNLTKTASPRNRCMRQSSLNPLAEEFVPTRMRVVAGSSAAPQRSPRQNPAVPPAPLTVYFSSPIGPQLPLFATFQPPIPFPYTSYCTWNPPLPPSNNYPFNQ